MTSYEVVLGIKAAAKKKADMIVFATKEGDKYARTDTDEIRVKDWGVIVRPEKGEPLFLCNQDIRVIISWRYPGSEEEEEPEPPKTFWQKTKEWYRKWKFIIS